MEKIVKTKLVYDESKKFFETFLNDTIKDMQNSDLDVEVQYQPIGLANNIKFSALVIGRQSDEIFIEKEIYKNDKLQEQLSE